MKKNIRTRYYLKTTRRPLTANKKENHFLLFMHKLKGSNKEWIDVAGLIYRIEECNEYMGWSYIDGEYEKQHWVEVY